MLRIIQEVQPSYVVAENVSGLINWDGGLVFHEIQIDLETSGYEVQPFVLPAVSVNAPHRRDRVWFVAYSDRNRKASDRSSNTIEKRRETPISQKGKGWESKAIQSDRFCNLPRVTSNTNSKLLQRRGYQNRPKETIGHFSSPFRRGAWENFPTQSPICDGDDGLSSRLDAITFPKWRTESVKGGGNAIVPQVALNIFRTIKAVEEKIIKTELENETSSYAEM